MKIIQPVFQVFISISERDDKRHFLKRSAFLWGVASAFPDFWVVVCHFLQIHSQRKLNTQRANWEGGKNHKTSQTRQWCEIVGALLKKCDRFAKSLLKNRGPEFHSGYIYGGQCIREVLAWWFRNGNHFRHLQLMRNRQHTGLSGSGRRQNGGRTGQNWGGEWGGALIRAPYKTQGARTEPPWEIITICTWVTKVSHPSYGWIQVASPLRRCYHTA